MNIYFSHVFVNKEYSNEKYMNLSKNPLLRTGLSQKLEHVRFREYLVYFLFAGVNADLMVAN